MASLKEVRTRIESVKSTQQITSAMKMVSASKLRKAQTVIHGMQPYAKKMVAKMDEVGFGNCTNTGSCETRCPKGLKLTHIAKMNREFITAKIVAEKST